MKLLGGKMPASKNSASTKKVKSTKKTTVLKPKKAVLKPAAKKSPISKTINSAKKIAKVGDKVSDFSLLMTGGEFKLSSYKGKNLVIYFYPKDSTPGCTQEGLDFSRLYPSFKKANTLVFGVSRDSMKSHEKFKLNQNYTVDLISDTDELACEIFGTMKMKKLYGREYLGVDRSTFIIDREGRLIKEWRGVKVKGHAEEVLAYVQKL